ncbi:Ig-like domain-containing protein [Priestia megaterium]|uniref:Ig-like domain-containing protein n=1 Tax=Priestia megaterium TaxID=1404 RepID=UPI0022A67951|nr:Ig-like domain-containing protein [Priestia megaterium]
MIWVKDGGIRWNVSFRIGEDRRLMNEVVGVDRDGNGLRFRLERAAGKGVGVVNRDGRFSYEGKVKFNGRDEFRVLVWDGEGGRGV